jgi:hypothetical protein
VHRPLLPHQKKFAELKGQANVCVTMDLIVSTTRNYMQQP